MSAGLIECAKVHRATRTGQRHEEGQAHGDCSCGQRVQDQPLELLTTISQPHTFSVKYDAAHSWPLRARQFITGKALVYVRLSSNTRRYRTGGIANRRLCHKRRAAGSHPPPLDLLLWSLVRVGPELLQGLLCLPKVLRHAVFPSRERRHFRRRLLEHLPEGELVLAVSVCRDRVQQRVHADGVRR